MIYNSIKLLVLHTGVDTREMRQYLAAVLRQLFFGEDFQCTYYVDERRIGTDSYILPLIKR